MADQNHPADLEMHRQASLENSGIEEMELASQEELREIEEEEKADAEKLRTLILANILVRWRNHFKEHFQLRRKSEDVYLRASGDTISGLGDVTWRDVWASYKAENREKFYSSNGGMNPFQYRTREWIEEQIQKQIKWRLDSGLAPITKYLARLGEICGLSVDFLGSQLEEYHFFSRDEDPEIERYVASGHWSCVAGLVVLDRSVIEFSMGSILPADMVEHGDVLVSFFRKVRDDNFDHIAEKPDKSTRGLMRCVRYVKNNQNLCRELV